MTKQHLDPAKLLEGATFKAGDKIVCVDAQPKIASISHHLAVLSKLREGETYTVAAAYDYRKATGDWALVLHEIETPFPLSWRGKRFTQASETGK